jgi:hypothetical protein
MIPMVYTHWVNADAAAIPFSFVYSFVHYKKEGRNTACTLGNLISGNKNQMNTSLVYISLTLFHLLVFMYMLGCKKERK